MHLLRLLMNIQQHRGMASATLGGDSGFRLALLDKRREIDLQLRRLATLPGDFDRRSEDFEREDVDALTRHWQDLTARLEQMSAFESMTRHTALIATLLGWLKAVGESCLREPAAGTGLALEAVVGNFVEKLPTLAETLGQARAMGSGLLASGQITAVGRVQMGYLAQRINDLVQEVGAGLSGAGVDPQLAGRFATVDKGVHQLQDVLHAHILSGTTGPGLSPADYYTVATEAINSVFALIHQLQERLETQA